MDRRERTEECPPRCFGSRVDRTRRRSSVRVTRSTGPSPRAPSRTDRPRGLVSPLRPHATGIRRPRRRPGRTGANRAPRAGCRAEAQDGGGEQYGEQGPAEYPGVNRCGEFGGARQTPDSTVGEGRAGDAVQVRARLLRVGQAHDHLAAVGDECRGQILVDQLPPLRPAEPAFLAAEAQGRPAHLLVRAAQPDLTTAVPEDEPVELRDVQLTGLVTALEVTHPDRFPDPDTYGVELAPAGVLGQYVQLSAHFGPARPAARKEECFHRHHEDKNDQRSGEHPARTGGQPGEHERVRMRRTAPVARPTSRAGSGSRSGSGGTGDG